MVTAPCLTFACLGSTLSCHKKLVGPITRLADDTRPPYCVDEKLAFMIILPSRQILWFHCRWHDALKDVTA